MTSYTLTCFIKSETFKDLTGALLVLCAEATPYKNSSSVVRVDCALGFVSLKDSPFLAQNGIQLELGSTKNLNKNPFNKCAIEELGTEILKSSSAGGLLSPVLLAQATARVNSPIRSNGLSSKEMCDRLTGDQLPIRDHDIILDKIYTRQGNHPHSSRSKGPCPPSDKFYTIKMGDLVFIKQKGE